MKRILFADLINNCGNPVIVTSHPRSGTHLTIDLIRKQFPEFKSYKLPFEPHDKLYLAIEALWARRGKSKLSERKAYNIIKRPERPIIKLHTYSWEILENQFPEWYKWIMLKGKIIYVHREVYSVLKSNYFFSRGFKNPDNISFSEFVQQSYCARKSRPAYWQEMMCVWSNKNSTLSIQYKDLITSPKKEIQKLADFIQSKAIYKEPILPKNEKSLLKYRIQRLISINPESSAILNIKSKKSLKVSEDDIEFIEKEILRVKNEYCN